jgi:hypothetical protein
MKQSIVWSEITHDDVVRAIEGLPSEGDPGHRLRARDGTPP